MKNVLLISIAFPPKNDPEALQTAKYFKYLSLDHRFKFSVVTSAFPTLFMPHEARLEKYDKGFVEKIEISIYESKLTNFALRKILPAGLDFPDSKFSFFWQWRRVIKKLKNRPNVIYSRSNPLSSALLAYKIKKKYDVPWVMHLSDPWVDSPAHTYQGRQLRFHTKWERLCFNAADVICFTSRKAIEFYSKKYADLQHKLKYFPNVYDPADQVPNPVEFKDKLRIVYTGGLSKGRSPIGFIEAIEMLNKKYPNLNRELEVIFAGSMDRTYKNYFLSNVSVVQHLGERTYDEALALARSAHILLNIDMEVKEEEKSMFFPSKLLDYFLMNRKILSLTNAESTTAKTLLNLNAIVLRQNDVEGISNVIMRALEAFKNKEKNYFLLNHIPGEFSAEVQSRNLGDLLYSL